MFSYPSAEAVLDDLGDKVVGGLVDATKATKVDLTLYRETFPSWVADHGERGLANWLHDRLWSHLRRGFVDIDSVTMADEGVLREIVVGMKYRARVKRHSAHDRIRSFPTTAALAFWAQSDTLAGMEEVRLGFGYRWDPELREIGSALISLRDGLGADAIWAVEVNGGAGEAGGTAIAWTPVDPSLPQIDLYSVIAETDEEQGT
ncbi:hypothetical protein V5P93_000023 [Actinokineospora auranticolor]|uniref:Uncharacterized protein n=1 Tax=Actinokineospora auranticolor TaxID=155976 RepID=A0A2S6GSM5_9PSEU|nr:hypothetical protein [Actinokineospora auranticolor]PPK68121.1 hypothetical protein CLV40_106356 [Actinokineospora auranticolor]